MMEMVVFAITLVTAQLIAGIAMMAVFMSKPFIKYYYKKIIRLVKDIEEMVEEMEEELD